MTGRPTRVVLLLLDLVVAVTAVGGGVALAAGAESGRFPVAWLDGTPFTDYVAPGVILAMVVGGTAGLAAIALVRDARLGARASMLAGLVLIGWILGEVVLVRSDNELVSPTEALYLVVGCVVVGLGLRLGRVARPASVVRLGRPSEGSAAREG